MPKKQNPLTPQEQRKRFEDEVRKLTSDGDFDPDVADAALEALTRKKADSRKTD